MVRNIRDRAFRAQPGGADRGRALVTAAEIFFEHDSASFGNKMMWVPVALGPVGAVAGVAGFFSQRMAKTALPVASAAIVVNGLQGVYLHARGISQKPGGWSNARYNLEMGPPLLAPLLVTMVGGMGLLAAILRGTRHVTGRATGRFPGFDVLSQAGHWDAVTADLITGQDRSAAGAAVLHRSRAAAAAALLNQLTGQCDEPLAVPVAEMVDARLAAGETDGWRYADMPEDGQAWRDTLGYLDKDAQARCGTQLRRRGGARPAGD